MSQVHRVTMFRSTVLLCTIAVQVLSAPNPNGCTESCTTYHSQRISEALAQQETAALNKLGQLPLDNTRPGNWTEHNEYRTDGGAGRVSEEKGQIVTGPRRVQYYKKKYSSSSRGLSPGDARSPSYDDVAQSILESQRAIGSASGLESLGHRSSYDEEHRRRIHQSSNSANIRSGRLEDFSDRVDDSQVLQHGQSPTASNGGNWHTSNSWRTDGGRGVVHEEQGQVVDGSAHMKYYRKNYSSSYSSGDAGVGLPSLNQPTLEGEIQRLQQQFDSFGREIQRSTVGQNILDVGQTAEHTGYVDEGHLTASNVQRQQPLSATGFESTHNEHRATTHHGVVARPSSGNYQRTTETQYHETETQGADFSNPQNSQVEDHRAGRTSQRLYVIPARPLETVQSSEAHRVYQKTVAPQRPISQSVVNEMQYHETQGADFSNPQNSQIEDLRAGRTSQRLYVIPARPLDTVQSSEAHQVYQETVASQRPVVHSVVNVRPVDRANDHLVRVPIHTSADYRSFHADGRDYRNSQMTDVQIQQSLDDLRRASSQHQTVNQHGINRHSGYTDANAEILSVAGQPGAINRVEEHWSASGHRSASTVPQPMTGSQIVRGYHANYVRSGQSDGQPGSYSSSNLENVDGQRVPGSSFNDGSTSSSAQYTIHGPRTSGCGVGMEENIWMRGTVTGARKNKRDTGRGYNRRNSEDYQQSQDLTQQTEDLTQQSGAFGDYAQQSSGNLEFGQQQQQAHSGNFEYGQETQQTEDLTQQTSGFGDYTQQQSGKLEFGQHDQQTEDLTQQTSGFGDYTQQQSGKLEFGQHNQQTEDLTQQTSGFGDYTQQQSGKLEFGQHSQQTEDLTQQTSGFGDYTQQQSGKLEFGQQTQQSEDLTQQTQQSEDLTQQTSGFGDYTQQQSGKLEFGQHSQQTEDLTQQTSGFGDHTQQQSGKLEFGQHSQQPEDLTQQTSGFGDHTQQQTGKLEFGQQSQQPEDLTQQTSGFGDYTQQQSGKLEFGQHSQHPEDLTQQTSSVGDYTQQQSGSLEFGQHNQQKTDINQQTSGFGVNTQQTVGNLQSGQQKPRPGTLDFDNQKPGSWSDAHIAVGHQETEDLTQQTEDLTQQTGDLTQQTEDLTQQTSGFGDYNQHTSGIRVVGKRDERHNGQFEFGQQSQQPEDLTQQTSGFGDYAQQQSGKLEFGHHSQRPEDLTQQTSGFGDYTQQQSGNLEFGQHSQQTEDLTQQTSGFGDYTQQQSGRLEFGQHSQQPDDLTQQTSGFGDYTQQSGKLEFGQHSQQPEDLTQQTSGFGDYTQQSGKLEFGQHSQQPEDLTQQTSGFGDYTQQSGKLEFGQHSQQPEDLTQQTSGFGDYTQQSGKLEFGQHSQQPEDLTQQTSGFGDYTQQSGKLEFGQHSQQPEDLTQQTSGFGDYTQQSGKLEFGQHSQQPEDLTQQTSGFGDYTQQSGKLEFGQHSQQPEDLTQQTSGFGDYTQQSGKLEFGQHSQQPEDLTQQTSGFGDYTQQSGKLEFGQHSQQPEDLTQQTSGFGDYTQQSGKLEFGQHSQQPEDLTQQTSGFGDYTQQTSGNSGFGQQHHQHQQHSGHLEFGQHTQPAEDLTQQTSGFGDYTQQTSGNLGFGQQHHQHQQHSGHLEFGQHTQQADDLTQQTSGFGDYTQQTSGNLQFGQQHEQQTGKLEFGQTMQHPFNHPTQDLSQQTQQSGFGDYTQQTSGNLQFGQQEQQQPGTIGFGEETTTAFPRKSQNTGVKGGRPRRPAPKPTLKHRQRRPHTDTEAGDTVIPSMNNSPFDVQPESDFDSVTRPKNTGKAQQENLPSVQSLEEQELAANRASPLTNDPSAQWHKSHNPGDLTNSENLEIQQTTHGVDDQFQKKSYKSRDNSAVPETRQNRQDSSVQSENDSEPKLEPRIIEAYGGNGAYDAEHNEDIFGKAKVNPSATLAPNSDSSEDPWDIRDRPIERPVETHVEKPIERPDETSVEELDPSRIMFPTDAPEVSTTTPSSFWGRVGHRLSTTYEKAKEKATSIFGK